jgi:predicted nucleotidyltransferase
MGYHRGVDVDGVIWIFNHDEVNSNHTAKHNSHALSLVCIGNFEVDTTTAAMRESINHQIAEWEDAYGKGFVLPHSAVKATACPGKNILKLDIWKGDKLRSV